MPDDFTAFPALHHLIAACSVLMMCQAIFIPRFGFGRIGDTLPLLISCAVMYKAAYDAIQTINNLTIVMFVLGAPVLFNFLCLDPIVRR